MIRKARGEDRPAVEAVVSAAYAPHAERIGRRPAPMDDDYGALIEAGRVHLAEADGAVLGLVVLLPAADGLLLDNVAVAPEAQGRGVGRRLLAFAEESARASGLRTVHLHTNAAMTGNIALYRRLGYAETHRGTEKSLHRVYMSKRLG